MSASMGQPEQRPRSKSTFSFKSDKSQTSPDGKRDKQHQRTESTDEKRKSQFTPATKADPNAAMNEVQPIAAALEAPTLQSLRAVQHTDTNGNAITDPDLSNPTRSRWERPLDTIRSFEAAIDKEYKRRSMAVRGDSGTDVGGFASRRSSYYDSGYGGNRNSQVGGYYGSRQSAAARESWADGGYGPQSGYGPPGGQRARYSRHQSDPGWNNRHSNGHDMYPSNGYQQSRDTINTGGSNGSQSDPYSADRSSENSSIERGGPVQAVQRPDLGEQYGFSGFGNGPQPILEEYGYGQGPSNGGGYFAEPQSGAYIPPPVPAKTGPPPPMHVQPVRPNEFQVPPAANRPNVLSRKSTEGSKKRQSWFKRRFSKES